jgi:acetylornithine deacetylase
VTFAIASQKNKEIKMDSVEKKIVQSVQALSDDILDFCSRLTAEPSTLGNEASALTVMEEELKKLSLDPLRIPIVPEKLCEHPGWAPVPWDYEGRYNVVAEKPAAGKGGRSALFNGHLDVVSPEPLSLWNHDPFEPIAKDGWLYGRGAGDMKSGVAAMTYALYAVEKAGFGLKAPVTLEAVIEEECCGNGALACLVEGYDADAVLIPEPLGQSILTGQIGVVWFKVSLFGVPRHVFEAQAGVNAIEKCVPVINSLRELEAEMNTDKHPMYEDIHHPINLNIGIIKGGDWPSTVPAAAEFHGRLSFFPGQTYQQTQQRIVDAVARTAQADPWLTENPPKVEFYGFKSEGHVVERDQPAFNTLSDCHRTFYGEDAASQYSTATTDVRVFHFFGHGQPTCYGPVAENIHGANERVDMESVIQTAKVYALFLARWCGITDELNSSKFTSGKQLRAIK